MSPLLERTSSLDLLDLEYIFSQHGLLTIHTFTKALEQRGVSIFLRDTQIEALQKTRILIPLYRLRKDLRASRKLAITEHMSLWLILSQVDTNGSALREERAAGYLTDPQTERFRPWKSYKRIVDEVPCSTSTFFFSPYQLLLAKSLASALVRMRIHDRGDAGYRYTLKHELLEQERFDACRLRNMKLVVALSALDRIYRPRITGEVTLPRSGQQGWEERQIFEKNFEPRAMLMWLGWSAEQVYQEAERLLLEANQIDPLRDWISLVRLCDSSQWEHLRGDALIAMDHRIAAEMLLQFYEDLVAMNAAPPLPSLVDFNLHHPLHDRLKSDKHTLDAVLTKYGLSPYPSLILFLEGETEMAIVPKAIAALDMQWPRSFIEIRNAHGIQASIDRYAAYIAPLVLGKRHPQAIELARPATRFLVLFDPEGVHANKATSEQQRTEWIDKLYKQVPSEYQSPSLREGFDKQIEVRTWEEGCFEFAHFTDEELLDAMKISCQRLNIQRFTIEKWQIEHARAQKKNIESIFPTKMYKRLTKTELAKDLWPILETKIHKAVATEAFDTIPLLAALWRAIEYADEVRRSSVVIPIPKTPSV